jgi:hypothetical protein
VTAALTPLTADGVGGLAGEADGRHQESYGADGRRGGDEGDDESQGLPDRRPEGADGQDDG